LFWQEFEPAEAYADPQRQVWPDRYPARMPDGGYLVLPMRDLGEFGLAGLIANQASFQVVDRIAGWMTELARDHAPEIVVGLPTLGHVFGAAVARALGHGNWVAPGTSRKLWYEDSLSVPLTSVTSPSTDRRMWLDPKLVERLAGRRVLLVDDVISTGSSIISGLELLQMVGVRPVAVVAAMFQGERWRPRLPADLSIKAAFSTPIFKGVVGGWRAIE
jgi:adenine/guanine phosphoribosyltransferase-like PRPP-binding protein